MKASMILLALAVLMAVATAALAGAAGEATQPAYAEAELDAPSPVTVVADAGGQDGAFLPASWLRSDRQVAACTFTECARQCDAICAPGCFCFGGCVDGACRCAQVCF